MSTFTYASPVGPPGIELGIPWPANLKVAPSGMPGGIRIVTVSVRVAHPVPRQVGQGSSMTRPRPAHSWHVVT